MAAAAQAAPGSRDTWGRPGGAGTRRGSPVTPGVPRHPATLTLWPWSQENLCAAGVRENISDCKAQGDLQKAQKSGASPPCSSRLCNARAQGHAVPFPLFIPAAALGKTQNDPGICTSERRELPRHEPQTFQKPPDFPTGGDDGAQHLRSAGQALLVPPQETFPLQKGEELYLLRLLNVFRAEQVSPKNVTMRHINWDFLSFTYKQLSPHTQSQSSI
ncbi:uncharacterized protein LOC129207837 [Grus americana]|uniref:uncharacterized protein LOC129207837 n=1 Tax=Grus americana TaxID=9117 RepID=UPI0024081B6C|nr:uncharacterized protein LOC129207837 [Grus americana]